MFYYVTQAILGSLVHFRTIKGSYYIHFHDATYVESRGIARHALYVVDVYQRHLSMAHTTRCRITKQPRDIENR